MIDNYWYSCVEVMNQYKYQYIHKSYIEVIEIPEPYLTNKLGESEIQ